MKRFSTIAIAAMLIFALNGSKASVPTGTFGLNAEFASDASELSLLFVASPDIELGFGIGFQSTSMTGDNLSDEAKEAETSYGFNIYGLYYLSHGDVNPYITLSVGYFVPYKETEGSTEYTFSEVDISAAFGGQVFLTKNFAVYIEAGFNYNVMNTTAKMSNVETDFGKNFMRLFTSAVGASLYF